MQGESYSNGAIDVPVGETDGLVARGILRSSPLQGLDLRLEYTRTDIDGMESDELYVCYGQPDWLAVWQGLFIEVKGTGSPLSVNIFNPAPERLEQELELDAGFGFGIFDVLLEYDRDDYEWTYPEEIFNDIGYVTTWDERSTRVAAAAGADLAERINVGLEAELMRRYYNVDYLEDPSSLEVIGTADVGLWPDWALLLNVRSISYMDVFRVTSTGEDYYFDDESYVAPYVALAYSPRENVELRVGYGVNPTNYLDTPVEGRANGRERWLSEYLWEHGGTDVLGAEAALEDARTIGVMAVITF